VGKASSQRSAAGRREPRTTSESRATSHVARAASHEPRVQGLDRLIHERLRLGIISALAVNDRLTFNELKALLETTDGNLNVHARKLEDAEYISVDKSFEGRMPRTEYRLTAAGKRALEKYLAHMEALIKAVRD
jgi:DNA-binding HxlR family transcriptional regulator